MDCPAEITASVLAFLWRVHGQSGFEPGVRRMQCDQKLEGSLRKLTFTSTLLTEFNASHRPVSGQLPSSHRRERQDFQTRMNEVYGSGVRQAG
jgi:hypothetical protein